MDFCFLQSITLIIPMLQLSQIWPVEALQDSFCVCLICLHHFWNACILSGIWCSRFILYIPTPAIFLPFKVWRSSQVAFPSPPHACFLCSAWTHTRHQAVHQVWMPSLPHQASNTPCQPIFLCGYLPHLAQILIPCADIPLSGQAPTPHTRLPSSADNLLIPLRLRHLTLVIILHECPSHPNVLYPKLGHPSTLSHSGFNALYQTTKPHPGWLQHPMLDNLPTCGYPPL